MTTRRCETRGDITHDIAHRDEEYQEKTDALQRDTDDITTERETIEDIEADGTAEVMEAVATTLKEAEDISTQEFADNENALEHVQGEGQEFESELNDRAETTENDRGRVAAAGQKVHGDAATARIQHAESQLQEDIEFLRAEEERARQSRERSVAEREVLRDIVSGKGH